MQSINPTSGEVVADYPETSADEVAAILRASEDAFRDWRRTPIDERAAILKRAGALLRERSEELARLMALEMGKPLTQGRAEAEKSAWGCDYYAENAHAFLKAEEVQTDATRSLVSFEPLGVVLAVMPWNFPFWQAFRFAAPALTAGNVALLKHASNVSGCALAIETILHDAGVPRDVFRTLLVPGSRVEAIIRAPEVAAVTLTGSTPAGLAVAAQAGSCLKKTVLELGGSDPYLILEDADLEKAAEACATARLINAGQSCIAAKRLLVVESVAEPFTELLVEKVGAQRMGDPFDETTDVGPQARHDLRDELHQQVQVSVEKGARLRLGGVVPEGPGAFYPPSVLVGVEPGMAAFDEELFGPVAAVTTVQDEKEGLRLANQTVFGLGAAVFTRDTARGERIAREELEAGSCFVNAFVRSDPRLPFGGVKQSGYGRELGVFGIREFVNVKTVYVA